VRAAEIVWPAITSGLLRGLFQHLGCISVEGVDVARRIDRVTLGSSLDSCSPNARIVGVEDDR
jgi:hypothetical protein